MQPTPEEHMPTQTQTINIPSMDTRAQDGFPPIVKWLAGVSIITIFLALYIMDRFVATNTQKEMIRDLKESNREDRKTQEAIADKAHQQFVEESKRVREQNAKQWETLRGLTDEIKRSNDNSSSIQKEMKDLISEMKRIKGGVP